MAPSNAVGIRPCTLWPGRKDMLFHNLLIQNVDYINADHQRDYIHIEDFCEVVVGVINNWMDFQGQVVDVGTGDLVSVSDLALKMGFKGKWLYDDTPNERTQNKADTTLLRKVFSKKFKKILD